MPHNKHGVSHGETDKHLDKLNKAFTRSFWECVFIFVSSNLYVQGSWFVCLGFCRRFVELVKKTNYILTFLHVFVFVPPAGCGVQIFADKAFCPVAPIPAPHPMNIQPISQLVILRNENTLCVFSFSRLSSDKQRRAMHPERNKIEFYFWLIFNTDFAKLSFLLASIWIPCHFVFAVHV